jgi:hypothetical protein
MEKFEVLDELTGKVLPSSTTDACKAMTRLEGLRKQRAFLVERLGAFRVACVTLRVRKQRAEAEVVRLRAELDAERAESAKWRDTAERCFSSAMKNAVALADERKGKRGA